MVISKDDTVLRLILADDIKEVPTDMLMIYRDYLLERVRDSGFVKLASETLKQIGGKPTVDRVENLVNVIRDMLAEEFFSRNNGD